MSFDKIVTVLVMSSAMLSLIACCESSIKCADEAAIIDSSVIAPAAVTTKEILKDEEAPALFNSVVYFSYNSYDLAAEDKEIIGAHAKKLLENLTLRLRVVGHTDERGTRAYNIALGKLRSKAVAHELELKGVPAGRITVISYGAKQPVTTSHNEQAWSKNRRAELIYEARN